MSDPSFFDQDSVSKVAGNQYEDIAGNPFTDALGFAKKFAGKIVRRTKNEYKKADRALGGWLPGGEKPNLVNRPPTAKPWAGRPGQFENKPQVQNALDAINKAGASPVGFAMQNPNDVALVSKFYKQHPEVANQYDLPVNMFLRYFGLGEKDLQLSQQQNADLMSGINEAKKRMSNPVLREQYINQSPEEFRNSYRNKIKSGLVPVDYPDLSDDSWSGGNNQAISSVGKFWAKPNPNGEGYTIKDVYDFPYAGLNRPGAKKDPIYSRSPVERLINSPITPTDFAENLVREGYGNPYEFNLKVK